MSKCAFSPSAQHFAQITHDNRVKIWNTVTGTMIYQFTPAAHAASPLHCLAWGSIPVQPVGGSDKKSKKARGSADAVAVGTGAGQILVLDVGTCELKWTLGGTSSTTSTDANNHISSNNSSINNSNSSGNINSSNHNHNNNGHIGGVNDIVFDPSGNYLYSVGQDLSLKAWSLQSGMTTNSFPVGKNASHRVAVHPKGGIVATAGSMIKVWDLSSNAPIQKFSGHATSVSCLEFSRDGSFLLSSASDRFVNLWDVSSLSSSSSAADAAAAGGGSGDAKKTTALVFTLSDVPLMLRTNRYESKKNKVLLEFLGISSSGIVEIFRVRSLKKGNSAPVSSNTKIFTTAAAAANNNNKHDDASASTTTATSSALAAKDGGIFCSNFDDDSEIIVARGSFAKPNFEKRNFVQPDGDMIPEVILHAKTGGLLLGDVQSPAAAAAAAQKAQKEAKSKKYERLDGSDVALMSSAVDVSMVDVAAGSGSGSGNVDSKKKKKDKEREEAAQAFEASLEEEMLGDRVKKMEALGKGEAKGKEAAFVLKRQDGVPKADSVIQILIQALQSGDNTLLEKALDVRDKQIIYITVQRLPQHLVPLFLKNIVDRFRSSPTRGILLINWVKAVLMSHATYLMSLPDLVSMLSPLFQLTDSRLSNFKKLLRLSGRLDLALAQVSMRGQTTAAKGLRHPLITYEESKKVGGGGKKKKKQQKQQHDNDEEEEEDEMVDDDDEEEEEDDGDGENVESDGEDTDDSEGEDKDNDDEDEDEEEDEDDEDMSDEE